MRTSKHDAQPKHDQNGPARKATGVSRRRLLSLMGTGGAAAVVGVSAAQSQRPLVAFAQDATLTPVAAIPATAPAADRLHVKPITERYFIPLGTSSEMRWTPEVTNQFIMDATHFFVRNHSATPVIGAEEWQLTVDGPGVDNPLQLTYQDLLAMPSQTVTRFIECAGNGRALYDTVLGNPGSGTQWTTGGYGVATWTGVPLAHILEQAGITGDAVSIMATGLDETGFEKPLPVVKAMAEDTMVVYGMNYGPLPHDHGFPVRLLVPGWVGSYNVKWLGSLHVGDEQLYSNWNTSSYVLIGPEYADPEGPPEGEIIREQTVKSAVALPWGATLEPGAQRITGYAWSPYASIAKVEVSLDGGESYEPADLMSPNIAAAGARWQYSFDAEPGEMTIITRATDTTGNSQWPVEEQIWNEKGYVWGAVIPHPVTFATGELSSTATPTAAATVAATRPAQTPTPQAAGTPAAGGQPAGVLAEAGREVYMDQCAQCHGQQGQGKLAPALIGDDANLATYDTARGLYNYIHSSMPEDNPGSLTDEQYLQSLAFLLLENGIVSEDRVLNFDNLRDIPLE
jgi:sulfane dehydrogenase subunit SoxC